MNHSVDVCALTGWAFHAFGRLLNPEVVICLDAGTKPESGALRILWEQFYNDKDLGGCCGETKAMLSHGCGYVFRPLIAAQNFEYKISYILDKPMESAFGYVTVLPGAFSAYRFRAIIGRPLEEYFRGDHTLPKRAPAPSTIGGFVRNMFLAEDRILSFEVIVKAGSRWHTRYVTAAKANTDIPEGMIEFIDQRRRWLNGAFAVTVYTIANVWRIHKSGHNLKRMVLFYFQMIFTVVSLVLSWFSLAGFLLTTFIITDITGKPPADSTVRPFPFGKATNIFNAVVQSMYSVTVVLQFFLSMGSQARGNFWSYATSFVIFGVIQFYFILNALYLVIRIFKEGAFDGTASNYGYIQTFYSAIGTPTVLVTFISVFGVYYVASFLYLDPWHMFFSYPQYLFVASSYTNILNVYAFSKWNDIRWGEKRGQTPETPQVENVLPSAPLLRPTPGNTSISGPFFEEADKPQADIDDAFEEVVKRALRPYVKDKKMDKKPTEEELHAIFRTRLVAAYMFSNFLLCIFIMNDSFDSLGFLVRSYHLVLGTLMLNSRPGGLLRAQGLVLSHFHVGNFNHILDKVFWKLCVLSFRSRAIFLEIRCMAPHISYLTACKRRFDRVQRALRELCECSSLSIPVSENRQKYFPPFLESVCLSYRGSISELYATKLAANLDVLQQPS